MREEINDYPALQLEDDGFMLSLKMDFVSNRTALFGVTDKETFSESIERLVSGNTACTDKGSSLPIYIPVFSDDGAMVGSKAIPVWSGVHIDFPLYPGLSKDEVEAFLYGNPQSLNSLGKEFLACDPAFKLAILVHYTVDNVIIHELAVESFLLGSYDEMPFEDNHYMETGLPSTSLTSVRVSTGMSSRRLKTPDGGLCITVGKAKTDGWIVRVRGTKPKEIVLRDCWQEMRRKNAEAGLPRFIIGGKEYATATLGQDGRVRERAGNADVDYMVAWVDSLIAADGTLPMRGSRVDWKKIHQDFEIENPNYTNCWTADTMRRTYNRRKQR